MEAPHGAANESLKGKATHAVETGAHILKDTVQGAAHKVGQAATAAQHSGMRETIVEKAKHAVEGVKETVTGMAEKVGVIRLCGLLVGGFVFAWDLELARYTN